MVNQRDPTPNSMTVPATRKPRLLWANAYCLLDTSSGASMAVREMLRQLVAQGYEVQVLGATVFDHEQGTTRLKPHWTAIQEKLGQLISVEDAPLLHRTLVTASTRRDQMTSQEEGLWFSWYQATLDEFKPDAVYYYGAGILDLLIAAEARSRDIPIMFYLANGNYEGKRWCRDVDLILTDSQATADMYAQTQGYSVTPVGAFIDPSRVVPDQLSRTRILYVNPEVGKGVGIVIMLALLLEQRRPDIVFEVVESRGKWADMVRQITKGRGSERESLSNVVVTEHTDDMRTVYGRARLLLVPSLWWESLGRVAVEAMLNGIPVIASDRGGLPEAIHDGGIKLALPPQCYEKPYKILPSEAGLEALIEEIILRFYDDEEFYADYVARAYRVGQTRHRLQTSTQRLLQAIAPLMAQRAGGRDADMDTSASDGDRDGAQAAAPQISVIFPVYNREAYLREAVESVLAQTFTNFEFLIILDGARPEVEAIINSYRDRRIRIIKFPHNLGVNAARNAGLRLARSPLIALMDSDDMALPERFARQYAWMQEHLEVTVCATNSIKLLEDGRRVSMRYPETDGMIKSRLLVVDSALLNPTTMFRTSFIRQHGLAYDANLPRDHDHRLFVEMMRLGARFYGLQEELLLYRRHGANVTNDRSGVDEEKSRVREIILPLFFPELTGKAYRVLLKGMGEKVQMTLDEANQFIDAVQQAKTETRSFVGEDREELLRLLEYYRQRILQSISR